MTKQPITRAMIIAARIRTYDQAIKDGATREQALSLAYHVTRKSLQKAA